MSNLDQAITPLALGDDDELCEWYRRPDIGEHASSSRLQAGRGAQGKSELCGECASLTQAMLGARLGSSYELLLPFEGYTFQKPYSQLRDDANFCALCRAIEDSVAFSQRYAASYASNTSPIPPGSHLILHPVNAYGGQCELEDVDGFLVAVAGDHIGETGLVYTEGKRGFLEFEVRETGMRTLNRTSRFCFVELLQRRACPIG